MRRAVSLSPLTFFCSSCSEVHKTIGAWTKSSYMISGESLGMCMLSESVSDWISDIEKKHVY